MHTRAGKRNKNRTIEKGRMDQSLVVGLIIYAEGRQGICFDTDHTAVTAQKRKEEGTSRLDRSSSHARLEFEHPTLIKRKQLTANGGHPSRNPG